MRVLLLATGEVEKLRPLTDTIPTPMLPILNRPVMEYTVELLARQGFKNLIATLFYLGGSIEAHFGTGRRWGVKLDYQLQRDALGSAGAIGWAGGSLGDTFVVMPADALLDVDLENLVTQHRAHGGLGTVVVHPRGQDQMPTVGIDGEGRVTTLSDTPNSRAPWFSTGIYVFQREILQHIPPRTRMDIHGDLLPRLLDDGAQLHGYQLRGYWNPIQSFADYQAAQRDALNSAWKRESSNGHFATPLDSSNTQEYTPGIWVGRNNVIHPTARLYPPVYIGSNCQIGREVELGPGAIIGTNVIIADEATINQSTILDNTYVGNLVNIENRFVNKNLVIDAATAENTPVVDSFLLGEAAPELVGYSMRQLLDSAVALFTLLLLAPLLIILALLSLVTTGRAFERVPVVSRAPQTLGGRRPLHKKHTFPMLRFAAEWLDRLEIRHLPALWNVLRGQMALVGVKPLGVPDDARLDEEWQQKRYDYPAGFTGLWYIQTAPDAELLETVVSDAYYVATRNWREDLRLLWKTPSAWLRRVRG